MTKDEFIQNCRSLGYCSKITAEAYCRDKEELTDDDYIQVYRIAEKIERRGSDGLHSYGKYGGKTTKTYKFYNGHEG
jgi:hypothetical protein